MTISIYQNKTFFELIVCPDTLIMVKFPNLEFMDTNGKIQTIPLTDIRTIK